jgi:GT2 family glycosyltransferase
MIDIIIVNFNAGKHLKTCVLSALKTSLPITIFISDNGSTDNSLTLLQENLSNHTNVHIQKNGKNLGFSKGNNAVFEKTTADYLLFLNPDCIIQPNTLASLITEFDQHPEVGMISCLIRNTDGTEQAGCRRNIPTPLRALTHLLKLNKLFPKYTSFTDFNLLQHPPPNKPIFVEAISGAFMLIRRKAIEEVGLLDENYFLHCEDLDWCMRFQERNWRILFVPTVDITHIKGICSQKNPIKVSWHKHCGMIRFYKKFFKKQYSKLLLWIVYSAIWLRFILIVASIFFRSEKSKDSALIVH